MEEKSKVATVKGEETEQLIPADEAYFPPYVEARFASIESRLAELEKAPKAQVVTREMQRQHRAIQLTQQVAGMLATGQATEEQLRNLPRPFAENYLQLIGPNWVDLAVALWMQAERER